ncbi:MAG: DUF1667 domain-containing protein [Treponema sp.]|nr:DUF1667 domain-containing protein [Treponema sp.]
MVNLTCIVCPIGCALAVESMSVTGNKCARGKDYALEEITAPKRTVTATASCSKGRVPVKTSSPCPKEKISALLKDIYKTQVELPVKTGDVIISNWNEANIDIVAARTIS